MAEATPSWCQEEGIEVQTHKAFRHPAPSPQLFGELYTWPSVRATEKNHVIWEKHKGMQISSKCNKEPALPAPSSRQYQLPS